MSRFYRQNVEEDHLLVTLNKNGKYHYLICSKKYSGTWRKHGSGGKGEFEEGDVMKLGKIE